MGIYPPTKHPNMELLKMGGMTFTAIDMGGHETARKLWKDYFDDEVHAIIFLVDAADSERYQEAKVELKALLKEEILKPVPILILGNKIDKKTSISESNLKEVLGIVNATTGKHLNDDVRPLEV